MNLMKRLEKYPGTGWQCYKYEYEYMKMCWHPHLSGGFQTAGYVCFLSQDSSGDAG